MTDRTALYSIDDRICDTENGAVAETCSDSGAAVDSGELLVFGKAAQLERFLDDRCKVLVFSDMHDIRIGDDLCGKHAVLIAVLRGHQAVGGEQDRCRNVRKFLLLILPCGAEIPLQMGVLPKLGIGMRGKHFPVSIDIDPFVLRLLKQLLQIIEIVAGNHDKRSLFHLQRYVHRSGVPVGAGICPVEHLHALIVDLADLQNDGKELIHAQVLTDGKECFGKEFIYRFIRISQHIGMIGVCRNASDPEQDQ